MESDFFDPSKEAELVALRGFQARVLSILNSQYPGREFAASLDGKCIELGLMKLNLAGVRSRFESRTQTDSELAEVVRVFLDDLIARADLPLSSEKTLGNVAALLMPQLITKRSAATHRETLDLISFPFAGEIEVALVVEAEKFCGFVTTDYFNNWIISPEKLLTIALDNLDERSRGNVAMFHAAPKGNIIMVEAGDGFDAARILLPTLRDRCRELLGESFYFAIPSTKFLVCWVKNEDEAYQGRNRIQSAFNFRTLPKPLSPLVYEHTETAEIKIVPGPVLDPRAASAPYN